MISKLILISLIILSCGSEKSPSKVEDDEDILKCNYRYFINDKHELDSNIVDCPDPVPVKPMRLHPLHIDSIKVWNIG